MWEDERGGRAGVKDKECVVADENSVSGSGLRAWGVVVRSTC